ncbi:MAG: ABC transporter ATP-binding protein, partial [Saprospiraceae bacterium]|nr:ABC transporter ATP-binding protein [Saprospiraceae bacterium]
NQLFEGTIAENVALGRRIPEADVFAAIQLLGLQDFLAAQPKGIHSVIDPEGKRLPRSIVQRLLIARAIVHRPRLLLMEDPLQYMSEQEKKNLIDYIMHPDRAWTVIIVTEYAYWTQKSTQTIQLDGHA